MKSYPIVNTAEFRNNVKELERFIDSLPNYQTEVDMKFLRLEEMDYIFEKSWKFTGIAVVPCFGKGVAKLAALFAPLSLPAPWWCAS